MALPAIPQPASTVVLLRPDRDQGFEIYLNRRPDKMDTYAGVYVFPGGRVEESDCSTAMISLTHGVTPAEAQQKLGAAEAPEVCLGYWVAAVRELFEEVGIHFFLRITPEHYPARFDTRFYLATLPPDQSPLDASEEVSESLWISPCVALDRCQADDFRMMPPTLMVLRTLSNHDSWESLRASFNL